MMLLPPVIRSSNQEDGLSGVVGALDLGVEVVFPVAGVGIDHGDVGDERVGRRDVEAAHGDAGDKLEGGDRGAQHAGQGAGLLADQFADPP